PVLPPSVLQPTDVAQLTDCSGGGFAHGFDLPQWEFVSPFPQWRLLEGVVTRSLPVSRDDNPFNHDDHDADLFVSPDPAMRGLLSAGRNETEIEVEWEHELVPEQYWPSIGDRVSDFGY